MIRTLVEPKETVLVDRDPLKKVLRFVDSEEHARSFGYEWSRYDRTYTDSTLSAALSRSRLELNLGFPLEFLKGMRVLEIGCGAGRFTEHLAAHAREVVAVDLSRAIYVNAALGKPNVLALQANLLNLPPFSEPIDLVLCRGVVQHTPEPVRTLKRLFDYVPEGGLVIFDVYKKNPGDWHDFKYVWRPFFKRYVPIERFDAFINRHERALFAWHHRLLGAFNAVPLFQRLVAKTPFYLGVNWHRQYPHVTERERYEIFKNELIDMLYSEYDQPMTPDEVIRTLAEIGQIPYSFDTERNHFRYKKRASMKPLRVRRTKNGVFPVAATGADGASS